MESELSFMFKSSVNVAGVVCPCGNRFTVFGSLPGPCTQCGRVYAIEVAVIETQPPSAAYIQQYLEREFPGLVSTETYVSHCPDCGKQCHKKEYPERHLVAWFCDHCGVNTGTPLR